MILAETIKLVNERLKVAGLTSKAFGVCEFLRKEDKRYPAEYLNGEWQSVGGYDKNGLTTYWRKTGTANVQTTRGELVACRNILNITYPLRLIIVAQNNKKNAYSEDHIFELVAGTIPGKYNISQTIWANLEINSYTNDREAIEAQEYVGVDVKMRNNFAYLSINCTLVVKADAECLTPNEA
jgi:hypothetical protein